MNEVLNCIKTRRGNRAYTDQPVPKEIIDAMLEAGLYAPSGMGTQCQVFLAITDKEVVDKLREANAKVMGMDIDPFYGANAVIVVLVDKSGRTAAYDGPIAVQNIMLAAHSMGIGTRWIHRAKEVFEQEEWKAFLKEKGLEGEYEGVANIIFGYPADEPAAADRKEGRIVYVD